MTCEYEFYLRQAINAIGKAAGCQRRCKYPLTQAQTFFNKENEIIIIKTKGHCVYGYIRAGYRNVYVHTLQDTLAKMNLLCVFDFYVHCNVQRRGIGKEIFNTLLYIHHNIKPCYIAYDCPTKAMIDFLHKYYALSCPIYQHNNMVIYKELLIAYEKQVTPKINHDVSAHGKMKSVLRDCGQRVIRDVVNTQGKVSDGLQWMNGDHRNKFRDCYLVTENMNNSGCTREKGNERRYNGNEERDYLGRNIRLEKELYRNRKENIEQLERFVNYNGRYRNDNNNKDNNNNNNYYYLKKNEYATVFDTL